MLVMRVMMMMLFRESKDDGVPSYIHSGPCYAE
jgi:hypothetical protein